MMLTTATITAMAATGAAATSLALTPLAGRLARAAGVVDRPGVRKVHCEPVPRVGGVAIGLATLGAAVTACVLGADHVPPGGWGGVVALLLGAVPVLAVGLLDDVFDLRSTYKLLALVAAALVFCAAGGAARDVVVNGHRVLGLGAASWPLTVLWVVTVTVSINFIDGLDGLAAGIVAAAAAVLGIGAAAGGYWPGAVVGFSLAGALGGFLAFNRRPASIFMGDCGSMFIGFALAAGSVLCNGHVGTLRAVALPAVALAVPLADTAATMLRRGVLQRRSLFAAERGHIHHRLMDAGLCHGHTVLLLHAVTLAGAGVAVVTVFVGGPVAAAAAVAFAGVLAVLFRAAGSVRSREVVMAVRRNRAINREARVYQHAFYDLQLRFRSARSTDDWWRHLCRAAEVLDFARVDLPLVRRDGSADVRKWRRVTDADVPAPADVIRADVPVPQRRDGAAVRATLELLPSTFLETGGLRVALFARLMGEFGLDGLPPQPRPSEVPAPAARPAVGGRFADLRVAVVHDVLRTDESEDATRVLGELLTVVPHADLFALVDARPDGCTGRPVRTGFVDRLPFASRRPGLYLPLMPLAAELLDVSGYDLVITSSSLAAKGVITRPDQLHVCYSHGRQSGVVGRSLVARGVAHYLAKWDCRSALGVDLFLADSDAEAGRIAAAFHRTATVVLPPPGGDADAAERFRADVSDRIAPAWSAFKAGPTATDRSPGEGRPAVRAAVSRPVGPIASLAVR